MVGVPFLQSGNGEPVQASSNLGLDAMGKRGYGFGRCVAIGRVGIIGIAFECPDQHVLRRT